MPDYWAGIAVAAVAKEAALSAIAAYGEDVMAAAKMITPLNKDPRMAWHRGTLMRSGDVERDEHGVTLRFSVDEPFNYAELQHETLPFVRDGRLMFAHEPPGRAKFLEQPFRTMVGGGGGPLNPQFTHAVQSAVRNALRRTP